MERKQTETQQASLSALQARSTQIGDRFVGRLEGHIHLAQGRMAIVGNEKAFVLIPWRDALGRQVGREMTLERTVRGIGWKLELERQRRLSL